MKSERKGLNRDAVRALNRKAVFERIVMRGPLSRVDLATELGLSRTAVADIAGDLLERGFVRESGPGESAGGRRPVLLEAYSETVCALGIEVTADELRSVAADPGGRVLARSVTAPPAGPAPDAVVEAIVEAARVLREGIADAMPANPAGVAYPVGIAWSGIVAPDGSVTSPDIPGTEQRPLPLGRLLPEQLRVPLIIDNDANLGALAELRYGAGRRRRDLVYVLATAGLGAGIVADGHLYRGHGAAGEIGHMLFDPQGERCECGNYGCLETVASTRALVRYLADGIRLGRRSELTAEVEAGTVSATRIIEAAQAGDPAASAALERVAECLGVAAANVANAYAPELVVLGGSVALGGDELRAPFEAVARQRTIDPIEARVDFELSRLGPYGPALGACAAAIDELVLYDELAAEPEQRSGGEERTSRG